MTRKSDHPHIDPRLAERIKRKKAQLDRYRPLPPDTVRRLNDDLRVANLIGQATEAGLDLYLEACAALPSDSYALLSKLAQSSDYSVEYLGWLARQGRVDAIKRGRQWYSTREAIEQYKAEAETGKRKRGRPVSRKNPIDQ
jgi:hypothetical protein